MIDFEFEPAVRAQLKMYHAVAENMMRPISREYDEREHENCDRGEGDGNYRVVS